MGITAATEQNLPSLSLPDTCYQNAQLLTQMNLFDSVNRASLLLLVPTKMSHKTPISHFSDTACVPNLSFSNWVIHSPL